ncbi:16S rRNA (cytosine(967)-C(5))-methyltransferase RsmB [Desulfatiferula olefinivorans]
MSNTARESALFILNALDRKPLTLDTVMNDFTEAHPKLDRRDQALVHALVYGVLRRRGTLDHVIGHFSKTPLAKISPEILNILRLGVFQIRYLSKIPESAAVNTSVELAKKTAPAWVVKFVNGVLRTVVRTPEVPFPDPAQNLTLSIALTRSFPTWLVQKWLNRFGEEETLALCDYLNTIPEISIRVNRLKTDRESLKHALSPHVTDPADTLYSPDGLSFHHPDRPIFLLPGFAEGGFQVQDEGAQLVSLVLDPKPFERVLDACAGLGGKTGHLAQLMNNRGEILAIDHDPAKLTALTRDMVRLGVTVVETRAMDLEKPVGIESLGWFDRILLDAPCSGMGVIRRNPDSKWSLTKKNLNRYKKRQVRLLSTVSGLLKPGGLLVYAVCSTEPEENEAVIDSFLHSHPDVTLVSDTDDLPEPIRPLKTLRGCLVSHPHRHHMDGFFIARLRRVAANGRTFPPEGILER